MAHPQPGIFGLGTRSHRHLEFDRRPGVDGRAILDALCGLREPAVTMGGANLVIGFGAGLWPEIAPDGGVPDGLVPFTPVEGIDGHRAPATQHDLWVWVHGTGEDVVLDMARYVAGLLDAVADVAIDRACFVYKDSRDLTGFVDGTANPSAVEAPLVVCVPDDQPGAGGSFVLTQRWVHDLAKFHALERPAQEAVFGRTKPDSVEFDDDAKPPTAHIARVEIEAEAGAEGHEGDELAIYRRSAPYGDVAEQGLFFVAFSRDLARLDRMLANMYGVGDDGLRDHLLDFTTPVTGSYYFAPSADVLGRLIVTEEA